MIQAHELRFGNKILNRAGEVITVQQILHSTIVYDSQMKVNQDHAMVLSNYEMEFTSKVVEEVKEAEFHELQCISLSADVLINCGFKNFQRVNWYMNHGTGHVEFQLTEKGLRLVQPTATWVVIQNLHQLQNFFFALTGKEIEVEL